MGWPIRIGAMTSRGALTGHLRALPQISAVLMPGIDSDTKVQGRVACKTAHVFVHETLAREHAHVASSPIGSGVLRWRSNIGFTLAHEHLVDLLGEGITIVDNLASPSIYDIQFLDAELVPRLLEDMIAHVVRLIRSSREGNEHSDALGLVGIEDDCDAAIGHLWLCSLVCVSRALQVWLVPTTECGQTFEAFCC
jgi:hypothetical protein